MYALQILVILATVYIAPALVLRPALLLKPETTLAIPFISLLLILMLHAGLSWTNLFEPIVVQAISAGLVLAAVLRVRHALFRGPRLSHWDDFSGLLVVLNIALCIYFGSALLLHGFDLHDEIYSWNMWAVQHFLGEKIDYYYTQAPYPQLFPKVLAYCYMLLGSIEPQTAVKTALVIFPFTIFTVLGLASGRNEKKYLILHLLLCYFILREVDLNEIFDDGMPDTLASTAVLLSIYLLERYRQRRDSVELLWLAIISAVVGVLAKQHALVWGLFSLPLILAIDVARHGESWRRVAISLVPVLVALVWMLTEGQNFQDNSGVVSRSFADRNVLQQLWFGLELYFVDAPAIAALLVLAVASVFRARRGLSILLLFALPSLAIWLLFASYDLRAGLTALLALAYLIAQGNYCLGTKTDAYSAASTTISPLFKYTLASLVFAIAVEQAAGKIFREQARHDDFVVGASLRNNLIRLFGANADVVSEHLMQGDEVRLWTPTNYVYGMFYGHIDVTRPSYEGGEYTSRMLLDELKLRQRSHATSAGDLPYGPGGEVLERLATEECPNLFTRVAGPDEPHKITVYKINVDLLSTGYCAP